MNAQALLRYTFHLPLHAQSIVKGHALPSRDGGREPDAGLRILLGFSGWRGRGFRPVAVVCIACVGEERTRDEREKCLLLLPPRARPILVTRSLTVVLSFLRKRGAIVIGEEDLLVMVVLFNCNLGRSGESCV